MSGSGPLKQSGALVLRWETAGRGAERQCDIRLLNSSASLRSETAERQFNIRMGRAEEEVLDKRTLEFCSDLVGFYSPLFDLVPLSFFNLVLSFFNIYLPDLFVLFCFCCSRGAIYFPLQVKVEISLSQY